MGQTVRGARALFYLKLAELAWFAFNRFLWMVMWRSSFGIHDVKTMVTVSQGIWLVLAIANPVLLWPFAEGRRGTPAESPARRALILTAVLLAVDVAFQLTHVTSFNASYQLASAARLTISLAADLFLWLAVIRALPSDPGLSNAYFALLGSTALLGLATMLLPHGTIPSSMGDVLSWLSQAMSLVGQLMMLVVLRRLLRDGALGPGDRVDATNDAVSLTPPPRAGGRDIAFGLVWLVGGALVTLVSYSAASSAGGGRYFITTGAIAYGLVRLVRGLVAVSSSEAPRQ